MQLDNGNRIDPGDCGRRTYMMTWRSSLTTLWLEQAVRYSSSCTFPHGSYVPYFSVCAYVCNIRNEYCCFFFSNMALCQSPITHNHSVIVLLLVSFSIIQLSILQYKVKSFKYVTGSFYSTPLTQIILWLAIFNDTNKLTWGS